MENAECQRSVSRILELARGERRTRNSPANLPDDAHFSGGVFANANRLRAVLEFLPTSFPVNHRNETVEGGRNRFGAAVFYPDTEPCWMFTFIGAGGWTAHLFAPWAWRARFTGAGVAR